MAFLSSIPASASATSPPVSQARSWRPDIDGLRALAILSVVLYHSGLPGFNGGFTGVDIFFVISGYLIGGHIYAEARAGTFSFLDFYARRAKRILPAFFAVLAFCIVVALVLLSPPETVWLARSAFAAALSASNVFFWHGAGYFDTRLGLNALLMTWSLGIEEQFYAAVPLLMLLIVRIRRRLTLAAIVALCVISFLFAWSALVNHPAFVFYMLPARAWELGAGVVLAVAELDWGRKVLFGRAAQVAGVVALALMLAPVLLLSGEVPFPGPAALPSVMGAALAMAAPSSWINRRILSLPPIVFIGKVSYSWYLWHWPLLAFLRAVYGGAAPQAQELAILAFSFVPAVLSYYCIEQPFRRSRRAPAWLLAGYGLTAVLALAICGALRLSDGAPQRFPALTAMIGAKGALEYDPCLTNIGSDRLMLASPCYDRASTGPAVAVWGDSHAASLAPGLRALAAGSGYTFVKLAKSSCPPLVGASHFMPRHPRFAAACQRYTAQALAQLESDPRISIVILHASWTGYLHRNSQDGWIVSSSRNPREMPSAAEAEAVFAQSAAATIEALQAAGKRVIVIDDVPTFGFEPMWKISNEQIPARRALVRWLGVPDAGDSGSAAPHDAEAVALATRLLRNAVANAARPDAPPVAYIDLKPALCDPAGECAWRLSNDLLYGDNNHLTAAGAQYALRNFHLPPPSQSDGAPREVGSR